MAGKNRRTKQIKNQPTYESIYDYIEVIYGQSSSIERRGNQLKSWWGDF